MPNWRPIPFVRLLLPLATGIIVQEKLQLEQTIYWLAVVLVLILSFLLKSALNKTNWQKRWIFGTLTNFALFYVGILLHFFHQENNNPEHFSHFTDQECSLQASILQITPKEKHFQLILEVNSIQKEVFHLTNGRLLAYLPIDSNSQKLEVGDHIFANVRISKTRKSLNPKAFDFANYLHFQNIHYQTYINADNWHLSAQSPDFSFFKSANQIQKKCLAILKKHLPENRDQAVASALILGYKPGLDDEIKTAYADTGAIHVLAVSGLHTGFIFLIINFLLGKIPLRAKWWNGLKTVIIILSLWAFALITGAAASVLRSATMFSFIAVGLAFNRQSNIYNTLAASAFCLLLYDPFLLYAPGFQLSYLAVAGIVYFQPLIYRLLYFKNKVADHLWQLIGVSAAAQLSTFPLSLYYFHKFPLFFWLSGLIVVPAAGIILPLGLLLFTFDKIPWLGWLIGKLLNGIIWTMNELIVLLQKLPGSLLDGIWVSPIVFLLICLSVTGLIFVIEKRQAGWIITTLASLTLISATNVHRQWKSLHQKEVVIYYQKGQTLIDFFDGRQSFTFSSAPQKSKNISYATENYRLFKKVNNNHFYALDTIEMRQDHILFRNGLFQFYDLKFAVVNNQTVLPKNRHFYDFIIISRNPGFSLADLKQSFEFNTIIIDGSNSKKNTRNWVDICKKEKVECINMYEFGAIVKVLNK